MLEAGMRRRWRFTPPQDAPAPPEEQARRLCARLGVHPLVAHLLIRRGLDEPATAHHFLQPRLSDLHDPALMPGAARAAERLDQAVREKQPIVIYGDYDVDGVTASAILWHTLRMAGADVTTYVPHRLDEGYGLNCDAIAELAHRDDGRTPVIISVDCGITAREPANTAKKLGVDLIITDHHQFDPARLPDAHTLVHPRLPHDPAHQPATSAPEIRNQKSEIRNAYPCEHLCGAGVAFKVAWQFAKVHCGDERVPAAFRDLLIDLLSYVALGTVADVVPLVGENRVLTIFGLERIKQTRFIGLQALIDAARLREDAIDAYHIGFVLGPRLNACGRMGHAKEAVHLLTAAEEPEASELAAFLTKENDRRRAAERQIFDEARQMVLDAGYDATDQRAIVVGHPEWHGGVIGIVASRLVEQFGRPVIMLRYDAEQGTAHGSARSIDGVSIHDALDACAAHLHRFGGHAMAAGLALPIESVDAFRAELVAFVNQQITAEELVGIVDIDAEVNLCDCSVELFSQVQRLAPFGRGNPTPRLVLRDVTLDAPPHCVGQSGKQLSLTLRQGPCVMRAIAFGMGDLAEQLPTGSRLDVVFEPKLSTWQGRVRAELHVKDLRLLDGAAAPAGAVRLGA